MKTALDSPCNRPLLSIVLSGTDSRSGLAGYISEHKFFEALSYDRSFTMCSNCRIFAKQSML
jgi:hypothetical protein